MIPLTQKSWWTVISGLRVAAEVYDKDAVDLNNFSGSADGGSNAHVMRLAEQFRRQAKEARELADEIEKYEGKDRRRS